jgi:hypothetical protein
VPALWLLLKKRTTGQDLTAQSLQDLAAVPEAGEISAPASTDPSFTCVSTESTSPLSNVSLRKKVSSAFDRGGSDADTES